MTAFELWDAHIAARNAVHHFDWSPASRHVDQAGDDMRWEPGLPAIRDPSGRLRAAYVKRLEGRPVLKQLEDVRDLIVSTIP